ncbi:MAG: hypothetical protein ABWZ26_01330 [Candidatus Nanopelagicales bacterium]
MSSNGRPGERLIRIGAVLGLVGALAAVVTVAPLLLGRDPFPTGVYLTAMLAPVGLGLAMVGVYAKARARSRSTPPPPVNVERRG